MASESSSMALEKMRPPYPPHVQSLGNPPTVNPDTPVSAVFLVLFLITGIAHAAIFITNKKKGHKFMFSMAFIMFCLIRVVSTSLRMAWASNTKNVKLSIAAQIFITAGTLILYIVNLFFVQRVIRARQPRIGWNKFFTLLFPKLFVALTITCLIMVITVVIQTFYTLNPRTLSIDRHIQWAVLCWLTLAAFLPLPILNITFLLPRRENVDKFGTGRFRTKVWILVSASTVLTLGAGFRCGISFMDPTPMNAPQPWYYHKAAFYCFDLLIDLAVVLAYAVIRVDRRFHIPDRAHGPGSYSGELMPVSSETKDPLFQGA